MIFIVYLALSSGDYAKYKDRYTDSFNWPLYCPGEIPT